MEKNKERKISYNTLLKRQWKVRKDSPYDEIDKIIRYILSLKKQEKTFESKRRKILFTSRCKN